MSQQTNPEAAPFNAINWFEIPTLNMDRAVSFYEKTLGRPLTRSVFGGMPHGVFPSKCAPGATHSVAGALVSSPNHQPGVNGTLIYLDCPDGVSAALSRASAHGAKVVVPTMPVGEHGWIAVFDDLDGNRIGLHAMAQ